MLGLHVGPTVGLPVRLTKNNSFANVAEEAQP